MSFLRQGITIGESYPEKYFYLILKFPVCVLDSFCVTAYFVFAANLGFSSNVLLSLCVFVHNFATPCSEIKTYLTLAFKSL